METEAAQAMNDAIPCYRCGGDMEPATTTYIVTVDERTRIFEHVPARVCTQCGERTFHERIVDLIQRIVREDCPSSRTADVSVYDLSAAPFAAEALRS